MRHNTQEPRLQGANGSLMCAHLVELQLPRLAMHAQQLPVADERGLAHLAAVNASWCAAGVLKIIVAQLQRSTA
jgi:hypothetical protein